ncbi:tetratricopeptide repeat protein, partial [Streptomyces nigra]|uniref:tetratricopeptide repeat protein n=1 Tax=Streptomyces nigra TaxID=1827580 RepID=UPI003806521B
MALPEDFLNPVALDGSPGQAFASHRVRAINNAKFLAWWNPLERFRGAEAGENETIMLLAHLHAAADEPDFASPGQPPSRILAPEILKTLKLKDDGLVGTSKDYDMTLKGLMVILYRYRSLLSDEDFNWVMDNLVLAAHDQGEGRTITGAHTVDIEYLDDFVAIYPETENHLLMIETSRYLINQLKNQSAGDVYDNASNGLRAWLLKFLQVIAKHDFLEFSARPYARHSIHALLNLYEFAADDDIRTGAQVILDYAMVKCAISSNRCRRVAPFRRHQEQINHQNNEYNDLLAQRGDQLSGYLMACTGSISADGKPTKFPAVYINQFTAVIAGTSTYRPPPAAYMWGMGVDNPTSLHRFYHGKRPQLVAAGEDAEGGLEIYYKSPSFLMSAGGMFLNSGYGRDEIDLFKDAWEQTSRAQATTLIPTRADVKFHDLIRFQPHPDPAVDPYADDPEDPDRYHTTAVSTGVHTRIMAGANLRPYVHKSMLEHETVGGPVLAVNGDRLLMSWVRKGPFIAPGPVSVAKVQYTNVLGIDGVEGVEDLRVPTFSLVAPAMTSINNRVYLAWQDSDDQLNIYFSDDRGNTFTATPRLADSTDLNPCLATHAGKLYLAWVGRGNKKINVARLALVGNTAGAFGIEIESKVVLGATSDAAPALASHNGRLFLAWRGSGNKQLNLAFSQDDGATFSDTKVLPDDSSELGPSLASHRGRLVIAWAGVSNDAINVAKVVLFGNTAGTFGIEGLADKNVLPYDSDAAPALASFNDLLFLAWKDIEDDYLHIELSRDGTFGVDGPWFFSDLNSEHRKFGFYLAAYRISAPLSACTLGLVYAREADEKGAAPMSFETFKETVLARNQHLPQQIGSVGDVYQFNAPDFDQTYSIRFQPTGDKYLARITTPSDLHTDLSKLPLVSGQAMNSPGGGHDGLIHIRQPGCATEIVLDFRDPNKPKVTDNIKACPQPWLDRADALRTIAQSLLQTGDVKHAIEAYTDRIAVYQLLTDADPGHVKHREGLAQAIFDLLYTRYSHLHPEQSLGLAHRGVYQFEVLSGLRTAGSTTPVDYEQLAGRTPNKYWEWALLTGALYNLAQVTQKAGDHAAAAEWKIKEIRVYERLTQVDPEKNRPLLANALFRLVYNFGSGLDNTAALAFAEQGLKEYELLAGLRSMGSTTPVDYEQLAGRTPNKYWEWALLTGALYNLA